MNPVNIMQSVLTVSVVIIGLGYFIIILYGFHFFIKYFISSLLVIGLIGIVLLLLTGCATERPLQVSAPCPALNIPDKPQYPIHDLKSTDGMSTVAKAYAASLYVCIRDDDALRKAVSPYQR